RACTCGSQDVANLTLPTTGLPVSSGPWARRGRAAAARAAAISNGSALFMGCLQGREWRGSLTRGRMAATGYPTLAADEGEHAPAAAAPPSAARVVGEPPPEACLAAAQCDVSVRVAARARGPPSTGRSRARA